MVQNIIVFAVVAAAVVAAAICLVRRFSGKGGCNCGCGNPDCKACKKS